MSILFYTMSSPREKLKAELALFIQHCVISDPLSNVAYTDNQTCSEGELLTVNVSCDGS